MEVENRYGLNLMQCPDNLEEIVYKEMKQSDSDGQRVSSEKDRRQGGVGGWS